MRIIKIDMNIKYKINYSGYIPLLRGILRLIDSGILPLDLLGPYIVFAMQADYDRAHTNYSTILRDDRQIAKLCHLSDSTIRRYKRELINIELLTTHQGLTRITNFDVFDTQTVKRITQSGNVNFEEVFKSPTKNLVLEDDCANLHSRLVQTIE